MRTSLLKSLTALTVLACLSLTACQPEPVQPKPKAPATYLEDGDDQPPKTGSGGGGGTPG
ncbi:hypothetical protein GCM10028807_53750 [Spirosoma daeguense]